MKFSQFVEGFLGLQGATSNWGSPSGGLASNARGVVQHAARPSDNGTAVVAAAESLAAALRNADRIAALSRSTTVRAVAPATPLPPAAKPAVMPPPSPPQNTGPAEPEQPVVQVVAAPDPAPPAVEAYVPPLPAAAPPPQVAEADSYGPPDNSMRWFNDWRASVGAGPVYIEGALEANARYTSQIGYHHLGDADAQATTPSLSERCVNEGLRAAGLEAFGQVKASQLLYMCEGQGAPVNCDKLFKGISMNTGGETIHFKILSNPDYTKMDCYCENKDNGLPCAQDSFTSRCTCDFKR
jgi:hypothetical protein